MGGFIPQARARYAERLAFVYDLFPRLKERRNQLAGTMSGGEQQMCAIGRALMSGPEVAVARRAFGGACAGGRAAGVRTGASAFVPSGLTVLIVEQNVQQVLRVVDRAYLLEAGTIRAAGTSSDMLQNDTIRQAYLGV